MTPNIPKNTLIVPWRVLNKDTRMAKVINTLTVLYKKKQYSEKSLRAIEILLKILKSLERYFSITKDKFFDLKKRLFIVANIINPQLSELLEILFTYPENINHLMKLNVEVENLSSLITTGNPATHDIYKYYAKWYKSASIYRIILSYLYNSNTKNK